MAGTTGKKRVGILLRVSTEMQVTQSDKQESDIPTQRKECLKFIDKNDDWIFANEYIEIGVSGFKNKMADRDKINKIIRDIEAKRIEILLVYMFDRLARTEDEAPVVVKRLVMMGAEVWSCREGQMKFDNHIDSLMNFITFWQAAGESRKTSERVTTAMTQMAEQGQYTGGRPPYGYMAVDTGRLTKKKLPEKMLVINENEARIVQIMFDLTVMHGYGCRRIAIHLNENGYGTKTDKQWQGSTIATMLANPIYKGIKAYKRTTTKSSTGLKGQWRTPREQWVMAPYNEKLAIVTEKLWDKAALIRKKNWEGREKSKGGTNGGWTQLLLIGSIYCGCCGAALVQGYTSYSWATQDGEKHKETRPTYKCCAKSNGKLGCEARSVYSQATIEGVVLDEVRHYLNSLKDIEISSELKKIEKSNLAYEQAVVKDLEKKVTTSEKRIAGLEEEIMKVIMGESVLPREKLAEMMEKENQILIQSKASLIEAKTTLNRRKLECVDLQALQSVIPAWNEVFDKADRDAQKLMLSKIIGRVTVWPDKITVKLRMEIEEFLKMAGVKSPTPYSHESDESNDNADWNCSNGGPY